MGVTVFGNVLVVLGASLVLRVDATEKAEVPILASPPVPMPHTDIVIMRMCLIEFILIIVEFYDKNDHAMQENIKHLCTGDILTDVRRYITDIQFMCPRSTYYDTCLLFKMAKYCRVYLHQKRKLLKIENRHFVANDLSYKVTIFLF